jgi:hypothetical protein
VVQPGISFRADVSRSEVGQDLTDVINLPTEARERVRCEVLDFLKPEFNAVGIEDDGEGVVGSNRKAQHRAIEGGRAGSIRGGAKGHESRGGEHEAYPLMFGDVNSWLTPVASWYEAAGPPRRRGGRFTPQISTCSSSCNEAQTGRPAMDTIGLDLHKRESQLCILADNGTITEQRMVTSRERFSAVLGNRSPARIILEASIESEWVAQHLESLGHEVVVADPNYAPMYATRARRVKTDKRDARALADTLKLGAYHNAHRVSAERRHVRAELAVREALVRTRTRYVSIAKALVRRDGLRVSSSESHLVAKKNSVPRALGYPGVRANAALSGTRTNQRADRCR